MHLEYKPAEQTMLDFAGTKYHYLDERTGTHTKSMFCTFYVIVRFTLFLMLVAIMKEYQSYNNEILLDLLSKSDEFAFTEIYSRFWKKLFVIAYNRLKEIQAAEDIVHDVFASLWANRGKIEIESLDNYLAIATKYMVLAKIRRKEKERIYNNTSQQTLTFELPIETSLHYKRILEIVKNEVEKLPEKCRLIFKYSRNEGMPVRQIAKELSISPKTVENQLNKAIKQLKRAIQTFLNFFVFLFSI